MNQIQLAKRLSPVFILFLLILSIIGGRLIYLQVVMGSELTRQSEANRIRHQTIPAHRGVIRDRHGTILAADEPIFHLRKQVPVISIPPNRLQRLGEGLGVNLSVLAKRLNNEGTRYLVRGLSDAQRIWFAENDSEFPKLRVQILPERKYHHGPVVASVVGYTGEINPAELRKRRGEGLSQGSLVGKAGIEKQYDHLLRGTNGLRWIETSADGEYLRTLKSPAPNEPTTGKSLDLNLDLELQQEIVDSFPSDSSGAVVVMEIPTGEIRAFHSHPTYDPNELIISGREKIRELLNRQGDPLHNRVTQSRIPPGSTFKILPYLSALADTEFSPSRRYFCNGEFRLGDHTFSCWKKEGHGMLSLDQGLINSCNVYFYRLIQDHSYQDVLKLGNHFQYHSLTEIDLPGEKNSQLSSPELKRSRTGQPWVGGDEVNAIIGQGYTLVTPIKQAQLLGSILTGKLITPRIADLKNQPGQDPSVSLKSKHRKRLVDTLDRVTDEGTGYWAQHDTSYQKISPDILGKTGTVQKIKRDDQEDTPPDDAWFISAAPVEDPQYVVVVFRIEAGSGGSVAAPHARQIYQAMVELNYFTEESRVTERESSRHDGPVAGSDVDPGAGS